MKDEFLSLYLESLFCAPLGNSLTHRRMLALARVDEEKEPVADRDGGSLNPGFSFSRGLHL